VVPPHVEYALTPLGTTLIEALRSLCLWAQENLDAVEAARQLHEQQARREGGRLSC
jgi:DNA-binding HxlR family transcriptional regulator